jgi:hypothetical protein
MSTYKWHELYKAALLETDWSKMEERIRAAESAIQNRKREFALNPGGTQAEHQRLADAMNGLSVLRSEVASWSIHKSQGKEVQPRPLAGNAERAEG